MSARQTEGPPLAEVACPSCARVGTLRLEDRLTARSLGTWSLAGPNSNESEKKLTMSANAWKLCRSKNPRHNAAHRLKRRGTPIPRPCRLCGSLFLWWQWRIGRDGRSRSNCGCWFDVSTAETVARGVP